MSDASRVDTVVVDGHRRLRRAWFPEEPWATMLIVHGLAEHSGRYERTGTLLAGAGVAVSSFDLLGHGSSAGIRCYVDSFADYLDEVEAEFAFSRRDGLPAVLLGHSLGGLIVLDYLTSGRPAPDAAVVSAPALTGGKAWQRAVAPVLGRFLPQMSIPSAITGEQLSRDPAVGEAYFGDPLVSTKTSARLGAEMFAAGDRVRSRLDRLEVPTFVIHGGSDELVPPSASAVLAEVPGVERRLYPKLRHESFNEPEGPAVVEDVATWLRGVLGR